MIVQERDTAFRSLSSYSGIPICLRSSRANSRRPLLSCYALLHYRLYEYISLSKEYPDDQILLVCDGAQKFGCSEKHNNSWYSTLYIRNEVFKSLNDVVDRLCNTICSLTNDMVKSITCRQWIADALLI